MMAATVTPQAPSLESFPNEIKLHILSCKSNWSQSYSASPACPLLVSFRHLNRQPENMS